jgi:hypothetical protein
MFEVTTAILRQFFDTKNGLSKSLREIHEATHLEVGFERHAVDSYENNSFTAIPFASTIEIGRPAAVWFCFSASIRRA